MADLTVDALLRDLGLNVIAITVLAYGLYFRRHRRRDLLLGYVALNISLFAVAAALASSSPLNVGVGFGLFAVLSIIRLRSDETTQGEIGYMMVALVLGLLTGLPGLVFEVKLLFVVVLVGAMFIADHPVLLPAARHQRFRVTLEVVHTDPEALRADLQARLGGDIKQVIVQDVDYVRDTTRVDVRVTYPSLRRTRPQHERLDA